MKVALFHNTGKLTGKPTAHKATGVKATKKRAWKKPKNKPRRPLSAYNLFFQHERNRIIHAPLSCGGKNEAEVEAKILMEQAPKPGIGPIRKRRPHRKSHGKIDFKELARKIAEKWKSIEPETKAVFEERAKVEKDRYKREIELWAEAQDPTKTAVTGTVDGERDQHRQQQQATEEAQEADVPLATLNQSVSTQSPVPVHLADNITLQQYPRHHRSRNRANPSVVARLSLMECLAMTQRTLEMANAVLMPSNVPQPKNGSNMQQIPLMQCNEPLMNSCTDPPELILSRCSSQVKEWICNRNNNSEKSMPNHSHQNSEIVPSDNFGIMAKCPSSSFHKRVSALSSAQFHSITTPGMEKLPSDNVALSAQSTTLQGGGSSLNELDMMRDDEIMDLFLSTFGSNETADCA